MQFDLKRGFIEGAQFDQTANGCNKENRKNPSENIKKQQIFRNLMPWLSLCGYGKTIGQYDRLLNSEIYYLSPQLKCFEFRRDLLSIPQPQIPNKKRGVWADWLSDLEEVEKIEVPRCLYGSSGNVVSCSLHGFADASDSTR